MKTSIQSLNALPPKQRLALALAEKARRVRGRALYLPATAANDDPSEAEDSPPPTHDAGSLVLDRTHVFSDLYYAKSRYKVYYGGRGSGKSWAIAEALIRLAAAMPIRVLCLREFQNSIKQSSHKVLKDTITRLGLQSWFTVTATAITSRTGAEFMFMGCFGNIDSVRSTEGIDICWVEEAHSIAEASWRVITPTIRKVGSEIWVSFNMDDENDATYRRLVKTKRDDVILHKVNYDQNPYFEQSPMYGDMLHDKATDYHLYEHIWLGAPRRISNSIIFSGKYRVGDLNDDPWFQPKAWMEYGQDERLFFGADFGFAQDPGALIRMFEWHQREEVPERGMMDTTRLIITHEAYATGVETDDLPEFWTSNVPDCRDWPIWADCSRPETISPLKNKHGFRIDGAEKWDGSVKDGITHLRNYHEIVISPQCPNTAREAHLYRYKVDPKIVDEHGQPQVLPIVIDKHNHAWDATRYGLNGQIQRGGSLGIWQRLGSD
jgi:phage terminase large subunit